MVYVTRGESDRADSWWGGKGGSSGRTVTVHGATRRSYRAPPRFVIGGVFVCGIVAGVFLTLVLADIYIADPRPPSAEPGSAQGVKARAGQKEVTLGLGRKKAVGLEALPPGSLAREESPQAELKRGTLSREEVWVETISEVPGPRIYIIHNLLSKSEREHIKALGTKAGLEKALIIPYGGVFFFFIALKPRVE